jgi:hypothetical protein
VSILESAEGVLIDRHFLCTKNVLGSVLSRLFGGMRLFSDVELRNFGTEIK